MKGFKKDGKFRPTENKNKSSLQKSNMSKKTLEQGLDESIEELKKRKTERIDREYDYFLQGMNDYGSGDVANAIEFADEVGIDGRELSDLVRDQAEQLETPVADVDINYIIYEHVLQMARNEIDNVLGYDFLNDFSGGTEFYTAGNYMATSYDWSEEAQNELQKKIDDASKGEKEKLKDDKFVKQFLEYVDVDLK